MKITHENKDGEMIIYLSGELGHHEALKVMHEMEDMVDFHSSLKLCLDMGDVNFMDSSGIAVAVNGHRMMAQRGGQFRIAHAQAHAMRVFDAAGISKTVKFF